MRKSTMDNMEKEIKKDIVKDNKKEDALKKKHGAFFWFVLTCIFSFIAGSSILIVSVFWDHRMYDSTNDSMIEDESDSFCSNFTPAFNSLSGSSSSYTGIV